MLDSVYSARRRRYDKVGRKMRTLRDGRQFEIYKRYFEPDDFHALNGRWGTDFRVVHVGEEAMAVAGGVRS
jgi:hypothetical protein